MSNDEMKAKHTPGPLEIRHYVDDGTMHVGACRLASCDVGTHERDTMASKRKVTKAECEQFMARAKASGFGPSELTVAELKQVLAIVTQQRRLSASMPSELAAQHERLIDLQLKLIRADLRKAMKAARA